MTTQSSETVREQAAARVEDYRARGRSRPRPVRLLLAVTGGLVLLASVPLVVVLPEAGVPILLLGLRLLAVEVAWAARACVWIDWRFSQMKQWFHRQGVLVRTAIVTGLLALAVGLLWLLVVELG
jgi:hypothetical protein